MTGEMQIILVAVIDISGISHSSNHSQCTYIHTSNLTNSSTSKLEISKVVLATGESPYYLFDSNLFPFMYSAETT